MPRRPRESGRGRGGARRRAEARRELRRRAETRAACREVAIGFQQVSELLHVAGIEFLGPLPPEIQHITVFSAGIHAGAKDPGAAKALVKFLTSL